EYGCRGGVPDRSRGVRARARRRRGGGGLAHARRRLPVPAPSSRHGRRVRRPAGAERLMEFRRHLPPVRDWRMPNLGERRTATRWALIVLGMVLLGYLTAFLFVFPTPILHARQTVPRVLGLT